MLDHKAAYEKHRNLLENPGDDSNMKALADAWGVLARHYGDRTAEATEFADAGLPALDVILHSVDKGLYPPPEALIALCESYKEYMLNPQLGRKGSLEEAFFGSPVQRIGNHAQRVWRQSLRIFMGFLLKQELEKGVKRREAAEKVSEFCSDVSEVLPGWAPPLWCFPRP